MLQKRLDLGRKPQFAFNIHVEQRFFAGSIAGQRKRPRRLVPQGESEHPVHLVEARDAVCVEQGNQRFNIAARSKRIPREFFAQRRCIVNLPVTRQPGVPGWIGEGLVGLGPVVDDVQSFHTDRRVRRPEGPRVVGAPVAEACSHACEQIRPFEGMLGQRNHSVDAAHDA